MDPEHQEAYDQLLEVMQVASDSIKKDGGDPKDQLKGALKAVDQFVLGKMESRPMDRPTWLFAVRSLKENLHVKLTALKESGEVE